jgi:ribose-phosphate pyrophosphokinase
MPDIQAFFTIPVHVIDPTPCIAEHIKSSVDLTDAYIVAPDKGAQERACALAHSLGIGHLSFDKIRHAPNAVRIVTSSPAQARGTTAIIVDDILDTGSTVQAVAQSLRKTEFVTIVGYFIHAVCSTNPHEHLLAQDLNAITVTNTLPQSQTSYGATIDLNPLIVHTVCKLFNHPKDME